MTTKTSDETDVRKDLFISYSSTSLTVIFFRSVILYLEVLKTAPLS